MIAKCERNDFYNQRYKLYDNAYEMMYGKVNFIAWDGFKTLKKEYSQTKYYQEVINECGYFRMYIGQ